MIVSTRRSSFIFTLIGALVCVVLSAVLFPLMARAASPDMPPRPAPVVPPRPVRRSQPKKKSMGALIELRAQFDRTWSWADDPWQGLETIVQWQDGWGDWHDVEGWRGGFDEVKGYEGRKSWWMSEDHFGTGPFRWAVYVGQDGEPVGLSEPFDMPRSVGQIVRVVVSLSS